MDLNQGMTVGYQIVSGQSGTFSLSVLYSPKSKTRVFLHHRLKNGVSP
jgi:hypothetical protein